MPQTNITLAKQKAKKIGVTVEPSTRKNKKLDVFDKAGNKVASIGDIRYSDYNLHNDDKRRQQYKMRHEKNRHTKGAAGYYADKILW